VKSVRVRSVALSALGLLLVAGAANADPSTAQKAMASQFFDDADKLFASGKIAEACPKYAESQRLDPQLGTMLHLADCYEKAGKTASAWATFKDAAEIAAQRRDGRETKARSRIADLEGKLPKLVVTVPVTAPPSVDIRQDGEIVSSAAWGTPVPVDPGKHTITAKAAGYKPWSTSVDVPKGATITRVTLADLEPEPVKAAPAPAPAAPGVLGTAAAPGEAPAQGENAASGSGAMQRNIAYAVGVAGVVGLGIGTLFGLKMKSKVSEREDVCGPEYLCKTPAQAEQIKQLTSDARGAASISAISFAIGGTAIVAGVALWLTAPSGGTKSASAIDVRPWVGPGNAGAAVTGRW
jgi:hypothetical protein